MLLNGIKWDKLTSDDIQKAIVEIEESFYFEFKEDGVSNKKLIEEVSAFANTYGGYIFIGVSDDKRIIGIREWDEQRITNAINDSISPTPVFDVRRFECQDEKEVLVIRIDEGPEPPYITNKGLIYERVSSSSCVIKDSGRLQHLYIKRLDRLKDMEEKVSIISLGNAYANLYAYLDMGFVMVNRNEELLFDRFWNVKLEDLFESGYENAISISRIGNSIVVNINGLSIKESEWVQKALPAGGNNFIEIMFDGSIRSRLLLYGGESEECYVNMTYSKFAHVIFSEVYNKLFGDYLEENFVYARKYEKLSVNKQFYPIYYIDEDSTSGNQEIKDINNKYLRAMHEHNKKTGKDIVITDDRIPKVGLYLIDDKTLTLNYGEEKRDTILSGLFSSSFLDIGSYYVDP